MIPLTIYQKKILEIFEKEPDLDCSASQFHAAHNIMSLKSVVYNFGILAKYGILNSEIGKDTYGRDLEVYSLSKSYNPNENLEIPTYKEVCRIGKVSKVSKTGIISKTSKPSIENKQKDGLHTLHVNPQKDILNSAATHKIKPEIIKIK